MTRRIVIDPVSRIEGHAKITLLLDDAGEVAEARFHVTEFRGFERFCEGRPLWEMPGLTARICGICPVSHLLASAKAADHILAVQIPPAAERLRRMMNLGQIIQSHALSFFHLSAPDLLFGMESDPDRRNIFGVMQAAPELARGGIRLRQFGQQVIEQLGGRKIHPAWAVPGGVSQALDAERAAAIRQGLDEAESFALHALEYFKQLLGGYEAEIRTFGNFPGLFMGLVGADGLWEHYGGTLRIVDSAGATVAADLDPAGYPAYLGEAVEPWSYLKFPFYRPRGYPAGSYRVGPLARLNVCRAFGTPHADEELAAYRALGGATVSASFFYHYARLIEIVAATEQLRRLLADPDLCSPHVRASAGINALEGVGVSEAPRGTLFHHYQVDADGLITRVNLLIATGQNNLAMNQTIAQIARHYIHGADVSEGVLNRLEAGIRAFDPCLSCSTHALGAMPLQVLVQAADGRLIAELSR
jgi:NAD-reducing hydrogenase large subunit